MREREREREKVVKIYLAINLSFDGKLSSPLQRNGEIAFLKISKKRKDDLILESPPRMLSDRRLHMYPRLFTLHRSEDSHNTDQRTMIL